MKTFSASGIILKRSDSQETDRIVTVFTREYGKLVCVARGVRKLTSSKLAAIEPGCFVKLHFIKTKSLPILREAVTLDDFAILKSSLADMRKLFQVLEMVDTLMPEDDEQREVFEIVLSLLVQMKQERVNKTYLVRSSFTQILSLLGFENSAQGSIGDQIQKLTQRQLKAFAFLST